ncbi:MAG: hypothetical protein DRJ05_17615 [Bacteroidetes bacterium]|nr:MAG: hypothetical protein DRJ05_17615 [Bacteroidota bacterium]
MVEINFINKPQMYEIKMRFSKQKTNTFEVYLFVFVLQYSVIVFFMALFGMFLNLKVFALPGWD